MTKYKGKVKWSLKNCKDLCFCIVTKDKLFSVFLCTSHFKHVFLLLPAKKPRSVLTGRPWVSLISVYHLQIISYYWFNGVIGDQMEQCKQIPYGGTCHSTLTYNYMLILNGLIQIQAYPFLWSWASTLISISNSCFKIELIISPTS